MTESILQIKDLKKSFGDNQILKGISLDVKQGEVVVILGSSGCGKSTLLRCINGLETIQGGDIPCDPLQNPPESYLFRDQHLKSQVDDSQKWTELQFPH